MNVVITEILGGHRTYHVAVLSRYHQGSCEPILRSTLRWGVRHAYISSLRLTSLRSAIAAFFKTSRLPAKPIRIEFLLRLVHDPGSGFGSLYIWPECILAMTPTLYSLVHFVTENRSTIIQIQVAAIPPNPIMTKQSGNETRVMTSIVIACDRPR